MAEIRLLKLPNNLFQPATPEDAKKCARFKTGDVMALEYKKKRNGQFFRKWHSLVQYAFEMWEPEEFDAPSINLKPAVVIPEKNYNRFRREVTMLAGRYHTVPCIKGGIRYEADSISFAAMDEDEFCDFYEATIRALMKWILKNYTREDIDNVLNNIGEYA